LRTIPIEVEEVEASDGVLHFDVESGVPSVDDRVAMRFGMARRSHVRGV
jgi:hypothetical protein